MTTLGNELRERRLLKTIEQKELATRTGLSAATICRIETCATANPSFENVCKMAKALRIPIKQLYDIVIDRGRDVH